MQQGIYRPQKNKKTEYSVRLILHNAGQVCKEQSTGLQKEQCCLQFAKDHMEKPEIYKKNLKKIKKKKKFCMDETKIEHFLF